MKKFFALLSLLFHWIWKFLRAGTALVMSLFLFSTIALFLLLIFHQPTIIIPDGSALVLAPRGNIVEKKSPLDPMSRIINNIAGLPLHEELLMQDVINGIRAAADDERIKLLVIAPDHMGNASLDQLHDIGRAIKMHQSLEEVIVLKQLYSSSSPSNSSGLTTLAILFAAAKINNPAAASRVASIITI